MELLIIIGVFILLILILRVIKIPKLGNMSLITGGIKTGKTTLSVHIAIRKLKEQRIKYYFKCFILAILKFFKIKKYLDMPKPEKPLLYSNIPLKCEYVPLTKDILLRNERFNYGSVMYVCESSLVADSMSYKDDNINEQLLLFNKLYAHEGKGSYLVYDTQSISDNHFAVRRCLSSYIHVHHTIKIPFFLLMWVREMSYSDDNNAVNTFDKDVEEDLKLIIVPKSVWKKFDCYCYSVLTDDLPVNNKTVMPVCLKAEDIISFKEWKNLKKNKKEVKKDEKVQ